MIKSLINFFNSTYNLFSEPQSEVQAFFSKSMEENDYEAMISLLENDYELTKKQKFIFAEVITNLVKKKIDITKISKHDANNRYIDSDYNPEEKEYLYMGISHKFGVADKEVAEILLSPKNIKYLELLFVSEIALEKKINAPKSKIDIFNNVCDAEHEKLLAILNYYQDNEQKRNSISSVLNLLKTRSPLNSFINDITFLQNKDTFFFTNLDKMNSFDVMYLNPDRSMKKKYKAYEFDDLNKLIGIKEHKIINPQSFLLPYFKNIFSRLGEQNKNVNDLAKMALSSEGIITFAIISNLSYSNTDIENYKPTQEQLIKVNEICNKYIKKSTVKFKHVYQTIIEHSKIFLSDSYNYTAGASQNLTKKSELTFYIDKLKKENLIKKRNSMNILEIIDFSDISLSLKTTFKTTYKLSKDLIDTNNLSIEEKNFCQNIDQNLLNLLNLQSSFIESKEQKIKYINSIEEQASLLLDSLKSILENCNKKNLSNIQQQVEELSLLNKVKSQTISK